MVSRKYIGGKKREENNIQQSQITTDLTLDRL